MEDLPVAPSYLQQLSSAGITIQNTSRWFNAATAYMTDAQRVRIAALSCVTAIEPVRTFVRHDLPASRSLLEKLTEPQADLLHSYGQFTGTGDTDSRTGCTQRPHHRTRRTRRHAGFGISLAP